MRIAWLFLLPVPMVLHAQQAPDTVHLREVEVAVPRLRDFAGGAKVQVMDSAVLARYRTTHLADLLAYETPIFIKSYGAGSLATMSLRGGSADHTAVLWNGFNISSPMNGQVDLSLLPVGLADRVTVQYGAASALWGSGAVGGAVHLDGQVEFGRGLLAEGGATFGSFGDRRQQLGLSLSKARWATSIRLFNTVARNDFPFYNPYVRGVPLQHQRHAGLEQRGLLAEQHVRLTARQRLSVRYWYQRSDRDIPPTAVQAEGSAAQQDASHRVAAEWRRTGERMNTTVRAAWFDERLDWHAFADAPPSPSRSRTVIAEAEAAYALARGHMMDLGLNTTHARGMSEGYPDGRTQGRTAAFASYRFSSRTERTTATLSLRQELVDGALVPFTWSVGGGHALTSWATVKAGIARVYRIPTFNDLYWVPGGNPDLLPESGHAGEAGIVLRNAPAKDITLTGEATLFAREMDDQIIWLPGPAYWTPTNIMQVFSRGVETRGEVAVRRGRTKLTLGFFTSYVLSTNERAKTANDASVSKQLIYVPLYSGQGRISVTRGGFSATWLMTYTGYRYTSTDNRSFLEPYLLANASLSYRFPLRGGFSAELSLQGNNLFDERYEVMAARPMPLRSVQAGARFYFQRPDHTTP